jgi:hypothetical protein
MRSAVALSLVSLLLFAACGPMSAVPAAAAQAPAPALDQPFTLKPGESVPVGAERVQVSFERVISDSRCPRDVQCIQAGEAVVRALVALPGRGREPLQLSTTPSQSSAAAGGFVLTLTDLQPVPPAARPLRPSEYRATFTLRRE